MARSLTNEIRAAEDSTAFAGDFLKALAERANAEDVIDGPWWFALGLMLGEGWRVLPPPCRREADELLDRTVAHAETLAAIDAADEDD